jgi:NAD(P)-dependent dehydrogenase (short-subunit alcohol dehydrogenase family)
MGRFEDKVVIVTGGAQGIGRVTAEKYAAEGATVIVTDVLPSVETTFAEIQAANPGLKGFAVLHDVTDEEQSKSVVERAVAEFGRVDILAHIAGVVQKAGLVEDTTLAEFQRVQGVNLIGPFLMCKATVPAMRANNYGRIVIIGSYYGRHGVAYFSAYNSSKAAVINFAASLALEVADAGITVNTVSPGMVNTGMHQDALRAEAVNRGITFEEMRDIEWGKTPFKRAGEPEDIANAVLFLSSDDASYVTGASLDVNGGVLTR